MSGRAGRTTFRRLRAPRPGNHQGCRCRTQTARRRTAIFRRTKLRSRRRFRPRLHQMQRVESTEGEAQLKAIIERHFEKTGSEKAEDILNNWDTDIGKFWQVYPPSEINNPVVKKDAIVEDNLRVSASAPDGSLCFLPVGGQMSPDQTTRCAD